MAKAAPQHLRNEWLIEPPDQWRLDDTGHGALEKSAWGMTEKLLVILCGCAAGCTCTR
jgi:hypothetical protein